jgi:diaminopimelate epimerase
MQYLGAVATVSVAELLCAGQLELPEDMTVNTLSGALEKVVYPDDDTSVDMLSGKQESPDGMSVDTPSGALDRGQPSSSMRRWSDSAERISAMGYR